MSGPILLLGATGTVGHATARRLAALGQDVLAAGRRDPEVQTIAFRKINLADTAALTQLMQAQKPRAVISCLASRTGVARDAWAIDHDAQQSVLTAALKADVQQFILLSAICVQKPRLAFQHAKLAFEATLKAAPIRHSIVRPTALFKSLSGQVARVRAGKPYLMFGDGRLTACKPISDRDLADFLISCLDTPARQNAVLPIGGPGPALTPRDMAETLFELTGQPPRTRSLPPGLLRSISGLLGVGGRLIPALDRKAELARIGHYYATESMLVWDESAQRYDADATPETGSDRLVDYYAALLSGKARLDRREHAVF
ncbi:MAG: NAD(P)H-binding protein [Pseudomonadota bacterium]